MKAIVSARAWSDEMRAAFGEEYSLVDLPDDSASLLTFLEPFGRFETYFPGQTNQMEGIKVSDTLQICFENDYD